MGTNDGFYYVAKADDTLVIIAGRYKISRWEDIYNHSNNSGLRSTRPDPKKIESGDKIWIPVVVPNRVAIPSGQKAVLRNAPEDRSVFYWTERALRQAGAVSGIPANYAERVFYLPELDSSIKIAEGPAPADWEGYHAGKHGVWERFSNLKGENVNMGKLYFNEKFRWVRSEYKNAKTGELIQFTDTQFNDLVNTAYQKAPAQTTDLSHIFDSKKFTSDVAQIYKQHIAASDSTMWQGRYLYRDGSMGELQTNVDFKAHGQNWRIALDAGTGKILNFFKIDYKYPPMKFTEIVIKWKGQVTDPVVHLAPNSTIRAEVSSSWKGLIGQGIKAGSVSGGLISGFLGSISGFKQEGIPGALKGLSVGLIVGGGVGGAVGGATALGQRIYPWIGKIVKIAGFVLSVASILLESIELSLDAPEWAKHEKDKDGNLWSFRNYKKEGTLFPQYTPGGIRIKCTDGTEFEFGEEFPWQSSFQETPINVFAKNEVGVLRWAKTKTPNGSFMWWWQSPNSGQEHIVTFRDQQTQDASLRRYEFEALFRA
jgi:hypothetical protein